MENRGYSAEITEVVGLDLTKKQIVAITTSDTSLPLDAYVEEHGEFEIENISGYVKVQIHNEQAKGEDKDYAKYIILTDDGESYSTGSESFMNTFINIFENMEGEDDWGIKVLRKPSKNFSGKYFLTCAVI